MLQDLKSDLETFSPKPLSDERFDQSHEWFEGQSNQQAQILQWLQSFTEKQISRHWRRAGSESEGFHILSVGCGSGILDLPLIKSLDDHVEASHANAKIQYTGIDPNPVACARFQEEFDKLDAASTQLSVMEKTVESYQHTGPVDLTHVVHSMYYFAEPAVTLGLLISHVAEHGELVIFQAPKGELNLLADCFWQGHTESPIWYSADLEKHLQDTQIGFSRSRLDAEVDVTACFDNQCEKGRLTLDFLVQSECETLSDPIRQSVLSYLRDISRQDEGKILAPHPVDAFVIHQPGESQTQAAASVAFSP